jgi:hypothetical protein
MTFIFKETVWSWRCIPTPAGLITALPPFSILKINTLLHTHSSEKVFQGNAPEGPTPGREWIIPQPCAHGSGFPCHAARTFSPLPAGLPPFAGTWAGAPNSHQESPRYMLEVMPGLTRGARLMIEFLHNYSAGLTRLASMIRS